MSKILISTTNNEQYVVDKIYYRAGFNAVTDPSKSPKALAFSIFNKNTAYLVSDDNVVIMPNQVVTIWEEDEEVIDVLFSIEDKILSK